jgi:3-deoxy-D-manno-octulosonic-acid transferase
VLTGPYTYNFTKAFEALLAAQGAGIVNSSGDIVALAGKLLGDPKEAERLGDAAKAGAANLGGAVAKTVDVVLKMLDARS